MNYRYLYIIFIVFIFSCATNKKNVAVTKAKASKVNEIIENKDFRVNVTAANPIASQDIAKLGLLPPGSNPHRILLSGDDYLKVKGDSIFVSLPFYGTQLVGTGNYNDGMGGYLFKDQIISENYKFNKNKEVHVMRYRTNFKKERLTIFVRLYNTSKADISINSSHRTSINFDGQVQL